MQTLHFGVSHFRGRLPLSLILVLGLLATTSCNVFDTHKKVQVPPLLSPMAAASTTELITEINRLAAVRSLQGKVDILFEDTSFASAGVAEKYRRADGVVTLQRPGKVYLVIQVPFIAKDIAQMTSDGETFRVAILQGDEKYRRFVKGSNSAVYEKLNLDGDPDTDSPSNSRRTMTEKETVSALANVRPQHVTEAVMLNPIASDNENRYLYSQSEFYQDEADTRPQKKNSRVVRGYYLLEEFFAAGGNQAKLIRRFWFDRLGGVRLVRFQSFDDSGQLEADINYADERPFGADGSVRLPSRIEITRPHDKYKLSLTYQDPAAVLIDREFRPEAFLLENRWQLPEVDLDSRKGRKITVNR